MLLLSISFIPLPTGIIGRYFSAPAAVVLYAASMALTGTIILLLWWYATNHHRLVDEDLDSDIIRFFTTRFLFPPIIFLLSIPLAFVNIFNPALSGSSLAAYFWVVLALLLNLHAIIYRRWMKVRPQDFQGDAPEAASVPPAAKKTQEGERAPEQTE